MLNERFMKIHVHIIEIIFVNVLFGIIFSSCYSISTVNYDIIVSSDNIKNKITIVLVSDLHNEISGNDQKILIKKIVDIDPDLIIISGDLIDHKTPMLGTRLLLSGINDITPIYYVTGNHEYWRNKIQIVYDELSQFNVKILSDEYEIIEIKNNKIVIAGIEDPYKRKYGSRDYNQIISMENAFRELDDVPFYKVLIAHRPEFIERYKKYSFNLVLSGHAHGGQFIFPGINGLYAPNQGFFPKYAGGIFFHENLTHVISRGLAVYHPVFPPRINNPPELVVIAIESDK